jgi:4-amino-4-deoxy-L-arabinose transferase-like glycosyltransferase
MPIAPVTLASDGSEGRSPIGASRTTLALMALAAGVFSFLLLLPGVELGYWDRDEPEYAGVAHAMAQSGDFLVPRLFGTLYPDKPPLAEWFSATSFHVFGETEFSGRLPHIFLAASSCVLILLLGTRLYGLSGGTYASLCLSTCFLFVIYGRFFMTDAALLFFTLLTITCILAVLEGRAGGVAVIVGGASLALALLAKGPIAYLSPFLFTAGYWLGRRPLHVSGLARMAALCSVSAVVGFPWFIATAHATQGESLTAFLIRENVNRYLRPMDGHKGPLGYFVLVIALGLFPWTGSLLLWKRFRGSRNPIRLGLLFWAGGVLLFFSFSATKLPHYLLPALPAFALLFADAFDPTSVADARMMAWAMALSGAALFLGVLFAASQWDLPGIAGRVIVPFAVVATLGVCALLLSFGATTRHFVLPIGVVASVMIAVFVPRALDTARCLPILGGAARRYRKVAEPLGGLKIDEPALGYYAGCRPTEHWSLPDDVARAAQRSPTRSVLVWLEATDALPLARDGRVRVQILASGFNLIDPTAQGKLELCRVAAR